MLLAIPDMDRGRCEFPHLKAVIIELKEGGLYKLGCKSGILDTSYSRNQFSPTLESFLTLADVPRDRELSLRAAARRRAWGQSRGSSAAPALDCIFIATPNGLA